MRCRQVVLCMSPARPAKGFEHGACVGVMQSQRRWRCSGGGCHEGGRRVGIEPDEGSAGRAS